MSKAQRKQKRQPQTRDLETKNYLQLLDIIPLTSNQRKTFQAFHAGKNIFLHGVAGTGKTFITLYLSLKELERNRYDKIVIYRSTVQSRDMGFLPGSIKEKTAAFEAPYHGIFQKLYNRSDAYQLMKNKGVIDFESTAFNRGITIENAIVIVDECQNLGDQELNTIITRIGEGCRIIFCGDIRQCDLDKRKERSGLYDFYKVIDHMDSFELIEFVAEDIVRSKLVREYILTRLRLEDEGCIKPLHV